MKENQQRATNSSTSFLEAAQRLRADQEQEVANLDNILAHLREFFVRLITSRLPTTRPDQSQGAERRDLKENNHSPRFF